MDIHTIQSQLDRIQCFRQSFKDKDFSFHIGSTGSFSLAKQGEKPYAYVRIYPQAIASALARPNKVSFFHKVFFGLSSTPYLTVRANQTCFQHGDF